MDKEKRYDLTIPQENIWIIEELNSNTNINNILGTFRIKQKLDLKTLNETMNKIVEMNDNPILLEFDSKQRYNSFDIGNSLKLEKNVKNTIRVKVKFDV